MNPLDAFWEWYKTLPPSHREAVACVIMTSLPPYPTKNIFDPKRMVEDFSTAFSFENDLPSREVCKVLTLRSAIEFFVAARRSDSGEWARDKAFWEYIIAEHPDYADAAGEALRRLPFQSAQWRRTCESWRALAEKHLTDKALRKWMDDMHLRKHAGWSERLRRK